MPEHHASKKKKPYKLLLLAVIAVAVIFVATNQSNISIEGILAKTSQNPWETALVIFLFYAVKSVTLVFPLMAIQITAGGLFGSAAALMMNSVGLLIDLTLPYWIGRFSSDEHIDNLVAKYPKFQAIVNEQQQNSFFVCFFLRVVNCLPGNVVSMYLGATRTPFFMYLISEFIGSLPYMFLATLMGDSIQDPTSPLFWVTVGIAVCLSGISILSYSLYRRHLKKQKETPSQ